jgi:hypothetical protein
MTRFDQILVLRVTSYELEFLARRLLSEMGSGIWDLGFPTYYGAHDVPDIVDLSQEWDVM